MVKTLTRINQECNNRFRNPKNESFPFYSSKSITRLVVLPLDKNHQLETYGKTFS